MYKPSFSLFLFVLCLWNWTVNQDLLSDHKPQWWFPSQTLKWKWHHIEEIFITGCTGSCHFDNFPVQPVVKISSIWWHFHFSQCASMQKHFHALTSLYCIFYFLCLYLCCDLWLSSRQWAAVIEQSRPSLLLMAFRHKWYVFTSAEGWQSIIDIFKLSLADLLQKQYGNVSMV